MFQVSNNHFMSSKYFIWDLHPSICLQDFSKLRSTFSDINGNSRFPRIIFISWNYLILKLENSKILKNLKGLCLYLLMVFNYYWGPLVIGGDGATWISIISPPFLVYIYIYTHQPLEQSTPKLT
jgi:hypothetical protein